ncbi:protein translocase subunit SecDF [Chitinophaga parva]|uniref:Multifunctional fusion protein n=1 Tax=Chitinophaga parva TaxID=2169414 RepID=A0A2T7BBD0_9BACT|nr:protein translocase subunit SecDF [Chitinophaga parva]PUZ21704.1 protein translocase subunit SecDF [Chitinophaga parva]
MQLKGLVRVFTVALILISVYQLSFTFVVRNYDKKVNEQAQNDVSKNFPSAAVKYPGDAQQQAFYQDTLNDQVKLRKQAILDSVGNAKIASFPWNVNYTTAKERELNLGLDLQGGMHVVLDVSVEDVIRSLSGRSKDGAFNQALKQANEMKKTSQSDYVTLFGQAYEQINPSGKLATIFANAYSKDIDYNSSNAKVLDVLRREARAAIQNTYLVLQKRIDKFGVSQPNVSLDENKGIISVELAGVDNRERVRKYLTGIANLEFREVYKGGVENYQNILVPVNEAIRAALMGKSADTSAARADSTATAAATPAAKDTTGGNGSLSQYLSDSSKASDKNAAKTKDAQLEELRRQNPLFAIMQPFFTQDNQPAPAPALGRILPKDTATLRAYLEIPAVRNVLPRDFVLAYGPENKEDKHAALEVYGLKVNPSNPAPRVSGEHIINARQDIRDGKVEVNMSMDNIGSKEWRKMTNDVSQGYNKDNPYSMNYVAVVLDNVVYSAPSVREEIAGGNSSIAGSFTAEEGTDLANILESGKMPAPAVIVQESVVGPSLGAESIHAGATSFLISFAVIFVLMLVYYNTAGIVANIALILNLLFTFGILASLGATLTMPGIAGLVLTVGMAVDTNVIIFERIKDELSLGKTYQQAVIDGYKRSYAPVLDGHITSLLTACILFYFGLGPVLGFATTQIIGLLLSLFCGIMVSRLVTDFWTNKKRHFEYFTPISRKIFKHANFDFVGKRKYAYVISAIVMVLGVASFFHGFRAGVDFSGGRSYTVRFEKDVPQGEVTAHLKDVFGAEPVVKTFGANNQLAITTGYKVEETGAAADKEVSTKLFEGLKPYLANGTTYEQFMSKNLLGSETVSATISTALRGGAIKATIFSLVVIFLYILLRFSKWQYSLGTIFSLLHDVLVTLAVFSFLKDVVPFPLELDQHFIAAILTVIGFSMNDTVIVFDRIRENFRSTKNGDRNTLINKAINSTLSRTIMTSLTVFLTILILFVFGGEVTRGFAFAMLIGVITGTYSSIFVAAPVLVDFDHKNELANESDVLEALEPKATAAASKKI